MIHLSVIDCMREISQEHNLEPLGQKRVVPGIAQNHAQRHLQRPECLHPAKRRRSQYIVASGDAGVFWKTRWPSCAVRGCEEGGEDSQRRVNTTSGYVELTVTLEQAKRSNHNRVHHPVDNEQTTMIGEHIKSKNSENALDR